MNNKKAPRRPVSNEKISFRVKKNVVLNEGDQVLLGDKKTKATIIRVLSKEACVIEAHIKNSIGRRLITPEDFKSGIMFYWQVEEREYKKGKK